MKQLVLIQHEILMDVIIDTHDFSTVLSSIPTTPGKEPVSDKEFIEKKKNDEKSMIARC